MAKYSAKPAAQTDLQARHAKVGADNYAVEDLNNLLKPLDGRYSIQGNEAVIISVVNNVEYAYDRNYLKIVDALGTFAQTFVKEQAQPGNKERIIVALLNVGGSLTGSAHWNAISIHVQPNNLDAKITYYSTTNLQNNLKLEKLMKRLEDIYRRY